MCSIEFFIFEVQLFLVKSDVIIVILFRHFINNKNYIIIFLVYTFMKDNARRNVWGDP